MSGEHKWGFHRLHAPWADRLVAEAELPPGSLVLDVGAGDGAITRALLDRGHTVLAVELHPGRAARLRAEFGPPVRVVQADARALRLPRRPFSVVANPPFAAHVGLIRRLVAPGSRLLSADLLLPNHAVSRWCGPTAPGARRWRQWFDARPGPGLPRRALRPPAPGPVRILRLRRIGPASG